MWKRWEKQETRLLEEVGFLFAVNTSPYGDATLRLRIAKGEATPTVQAVNCQLSTD